MTSNYSSRILWALLPFGIYFFVYWLLGLYPNYNVNPIDIRDIYDAELSLFGVNDGGTTVIPGAYCNVHNHPLLDFIAGISYLCWLPVPIGYTIWLAIRGKQGQAVRFSIAFLVVNLVGFVVYYLHPAAAPWYAIQYGFEPNFSAPGSEAGLARFDALTGIPFYHGFYAKNANVFAAMPSLHAAYPLVTTIFAFRYHNSWLTKSLFCLMTLGIWFSAIYTAHHYCLDVIAGIIVTLVGVLICDLIRNYRLSHSKQ